MGLMRARQQVVSPSRIDRRYVWHAVKMLALRPPAPPAVSSSGLSISSIHRAEPSRETRPRYKVWITSPTAGKRMAVLRKRRTSDVIEPGLRDD